MSDYKLGIYKKIEVYDFEEIEHLLKKGHILFVVYQNIHDDKIKMVRGYMYTEDENHWYRCYVNSSDYIKNYCCTSTMVPYYKATDKTIEPYELHNGVIPLYNLEKTLKAEITNKKPEYQRSIYISNETEDGSNFGGPLECLFCEKISNFSE